jgi:uronate dehydrogenase
LLRVSDLAPLGNARNGEEVAHADLREPEAVDRMMEGIDSVIHVGGISEEDTWPNILATNIIGTLNVFEAARRHGVKRLVFASTSHVTGFYRRDQRIDPLFPKRVDSRYAVSKAFGEDLGSLYADKYGIRVMAIRIGRCLERPYNERLLSTWISRRDLIQLVQIGLEEPDLRFAVVYGVSDNKRGWWDNSAAFELGYRPQDDSEAFAEEIMAMDPPEDADEIALRVQGGLFASAEYDGDLSGI